MMSAGVVYAPHTVSTGASTFVATLIFMIRFRWPPSAMAQSVYDSRCMFHNKDYHGRDLSDTRTNHFLSCGPIIRIGRLARG
jgi:hypothetical protein